MKRISTWLAAGMLLVCGASAGADEPDLAELKTTIEALRAKLRDQGNRLAELEDQQAAQNASLAEIAKDMADSAATQPSCPGWLDDLKFYGDLRLRWQSDCFSGEDRSNRKRRNRARYRLRFGVTKTWLDEQVEVGFRLASGSSSDPTSTNQTFEANFEEHDVWIDRAYAKYEPKFLPGLTAIAGKMGTPFVHTNLIWDSDVNPEGVWVQYKPACSETCSPFVSVGAWSLSERVARPNGLDDIGGGDTAFDTELVDATLMTYQAGIEWRPAKDVKWTNAVTYYEYEDYEQTYTNAGGNTVYGVPVTSPLGATDSYSRISDFRMINLTSMIQWRMCNLPWKAYVDYVHNCGDVVASEGFRDQDDGYAFGLKVGKNKKKGDWSLGYKYAWIEANCTPGGFNDSDFGGSNRKGHVLSGAYNLTDFLTLGAALFVTEPIAGADADNGYTDVTTMFDLIWKF